MIRKRVLLIALLAAGVLSLLPLRLASQTAIPYPLNFSTQWQSLTGFLPNSSTAVTTADSYIDYLHLANITGSPVTVTITENSTNCSSGVCQWWPTISIPANTVYIQAMGGVYSPGGVKWSASNASAVVGWIRGKYAVSTNGQ